MYNQFMYYLMQNILLVDNISGQVTGAVSDNANVHAAFSL